MDIAQIEDEFKLIECNCFNGTGFYMHDIEGVVRAVNDFVQKNLKSENSSPLYQLQKYYPKTHGELIKKQFEVAHDCILKNLKNGIAVGLYRNSLNVEFISRLYFLTITGIKNEELFPKETFPAYKTVITYLDYHIRGIATIKGVTILEKIQQIREK